VVATIGNVREETSTPTAERRAGTRTDRRKHSRNGRRGNDPHRNWWRLVWLFAGYALYVSARSLPAGIKDKIFKRSTLTPS
jgi:hypothetical protein